MKSIDHKTIVTLPGTQLKKGDAFSFACHNQLSCFNRCCRNLNLFLYPFDVMRLKNRLNISSGEFIERYVDIVMRKDNYFPDVLLQMSETKEKTCPFLSDTGCTVYPDRPDTCRSFPVEGGLLYNAEKKEKEVIHFFRPPGFCKGQEETTQWAANTYLKDQRAGLYQRMTQKWAEIKSHFNENPWGNSDINGPMGKMAFMAVYNVDTFRQFVFKSSFLNRYKINPTLIQRVQTSDITLLNLGMEWLKLVVWGIKSSSIHIK